MGAANCMAIALPLGMDQKTGLVIALGSKRKKSEQLPAPINPGFHLGGGKNEHKSDG